MSEMRERVAKAIRVKSAEIDHRPGNSDPDGMWFADEFASVAIAAMREPTPEMLLATKEAFKEINEVIAFAHNHGMILTIHPDGYAFPRAWRMAIAEALK
jgi:hypothetical protein